MTWSYGDWHEDMVALYDDDTDRMVCWLQKKGGLDTKALTLIKAAPDLLKALATMMGAADFDCLDDKSNVWRSVMIEARDALAKAEGRGE